MIKEITVEDGYDLINSGEAIIIDVREADEYVASHIEDAILLPLSVFAQKFRREDYPADQKIILQCLGGVRSMNACHIAQDLSSGQDDFYNLIGGLNAWVKAGLPIIR